MVFNTALISVFLFSLSLSLSLSFLISKVQKNLTVGIPLLLDKDPGFRSTAENIIIVGENIQWSL